MAIRSFKNEGAAQVYQGNCPRGFPAKIFNVTRRKLAMLDAAVEIKDLMAPPNNKLHALHREREGQHAIWINDQYRLCFRWNNGDAYDVEITDYHDE
jgi:toxin HigB-1